MNRILTEGRIEEQVVLLQIVRAVLSGKPKLLGRVGALRIRDYSIVKHLFDSLSNSLQKRLFHPHVVSAILSLFSLAVDEYASYITSELQEVFAAVLCYWKSNLEEVLQFVKNCSALPSFASSYSIILQQILFLFYDRTYNLIDLTLVALSSSLHTQILIHLQHIAASLQSHLSLLLPSLQFLLNQQSLTSSIHLSVYNLLSSILVETDISSFSTFFFTLIDSLLTPSRLPFMQSIVDLGCILAAKINNQFASSSTSSTLVIHNCFFRIGDSEASSVPETTPIPATALKEDSALIVPFNPQPASDSSFSFLPSFQLSTTSTHNTLLLVVFPPNPYSFPPTSLSSPANPPYQFPLFDSSTSLPQSPLFQSTLRLLNHISSFLFTHHITHASLAVVKHAVSHPSPLHSRWLPFPPRFLSALTPTSQTPFVPSK